MRSLALGVTLLSPFFLCACSSAATDGSGGDAATSAHAATGNVTDASTAAAGSPTGVTTNGATSTGATGASSGSGGGSGIPDPNSDGPYTLTEIDASITNASDGNVIPIHCAYPTAGPTAGPYPVIVVAHGFQLPVAQYQGYVKRLASFGYVALTADYPTSFFSVNNVDNAHDLLAALDWTSTAPELAGIADATNAGMTGHSLGGKLALLAATYDTRVKAAITLDPVDGGMGCTPATCPDTSDLMPGLHIPTGFVGETTDASGGSFGQSCAPAADNFTTFYAGTNSPSIEVTVNGANHMSFLDNEATCGLVCSFCNPATAANADVNDLSKAMVAAFYERYMRGNTDYDTYLTGAEAESRYVATNKATIVSR